MKKSLKSMFGKRVTKALDILSAPLLKNFSLFLVSYILLVGAELYHILSVGLIPFYVSQCGLVHCYLLMIPLSFLPRRLSALYKTILLIVLFLFFVIDIVCIIVYGNALPAVGEDALSAVLATNISEASEFFLFYFNITHLLCLALLAAVISALYIVVRRTRFSPPAIVRLSVSFVLIFSSIVIVKEFNPYRYAYLTYMVNYEPVPDLSGFRQNPIVQVTSEAPENIVLIIGESLTKAHCSLYGYEKETNPLLQKLVVDSSLTVFKDVDSYTVTTIPSMKALMMGWGEEMSDSIEWHKCLTLIEVMQKSGYSVNWISNQSKSGLYDNEVGRFSDLCDFQYFAGGKLLGLNRKTLDEALIQPVKERVENAPGRNLYIIHLMGQHADFRHRYPDAFSKFIADDYLETHPQMAEMHRWKIAEYDNSVLYNDSIVYELMRSFDGREAVVLYFSDHALDVFQSRDDYVGHAVSENVENEVYGHLIPFVVYTTSALKEKFPHLCSRISSATDVAYRTDSLMYTVMDVAGVETVNGVSYKSKSLFK